MRCGFGVSCAAPSSHPLVCNAAAFLTTAACFAFWLAACESMSSEEQTPHLAAGSSICTCGDHRCSPGAARAPAAAAAARGPELRWAPGIPELREDRSHLEHVLRTSAGDGYWVILCLPRICLIWFFSFCCSSG